MFLRAGKRPPPPGRGDARRTGFSCRGSRAVRGMQRPQTMRAPAVIRHTSGTPCDSHGGPTSARTTRFTTAARMRLAVLWAWCLIRLQEAVEWACVKVNGDGVVISTTCGAVNACVNGAAELMGTTDRLLKRSVYELHRHVIYCPPRWLGVCWRKTRQIS